MKNQNSQENVVSNKKGWSAGVLLLAAAVLLFIGYGTRGVVDSITKKNSVNASADHLAMGNLNDNEKSSSAKTSKHTSSSRTQDQNSAEKPRHLQFRSDAEFIEKIGEVAALGSRKQKSQMILEMLPYITAENAREVQLALGRAQDNGSPISTEVWDQLWSQWGKVDGSGALNFIMKNLLDYSDPMTVAQAMSVSDPEGLKAWLSANKENAEHPAWTIAYAVSLSKSGAQDVNKATSTMLSEVSEPNARMRCLDILTDQAMLAGGADAVKNYYQSLPEEARPLATGMILNKLTSADAASAMEWFQKTILKPESTLEEYPSSMLSAMARQNSGKAIEWLCNLDSTKFTENTNPQVRALVDTCMQRDFSSFYNFLKDNINKPQMQNAVQKIIEQIPYDPSNHASESIHGLLK